MVNTAALGHGHGMRRALNVINRNSRLHWQGGSWERVQDRKFPNFATFT